MKKRDFISKYSGMAREVIEALLEMYSNEGIYQIEDTQVLKLDPFIRMGKPAALVKLFGGKDGYLQAIRELEEQLSGYGFFRCHASYLVAAEAIQEIRQSEILLKDGNIVPISQRRRKAFMSALSSYYGDTF